MGGCSSTVNVKEQVVGGSASVPYRRTTPSAEFQLLQAAHNTDVAEVQRLLLGTEVDVVSTFEEALATTANDMSASPCVATGVVSSAPVGEEKEISSSSSALQRAPTDILVQEEHLRRVKANVKVNAADPATGNTALHMVTQNVGIRATESHVQIVQLLWACGADPNLRNRQGKTPLHILCEASRPHRKDRHLIKQVIETILSTSAKKKYSASLSQQESLVTKTSPEVSTQYPKLDVDAVEWSSSRQSPLHMATMTGDLDLMQLLVEVGGADVNIKNAAGLTPLHITAKLNRTGCAMYLLSRGTILISEPAAPAQVRGRRGHGGEKGQTALHIALLEGHTQMASLLICSGAKVNVKTQDRKVTPLHLCARLADEAAAVEITRLLLDGEAVVDARDVNGQTPLHHAALQRNDAVAEILVGVGKADIYARDQSGRQVVDLVV